MNNYFVTLITLFALPLYRYRIVESDQRGYGTYNKSTNTWSGYISEILKKKADILVIDLDITHTRFRVVDYLTQIGCEM